MKEPDISVIISTYNQPEWLEKVLWSYAFQTYTNFEVIIADDGSDSETKETIDKMQQEVSYPICHVWHEDLGFRKTVILNKAIEQSKSAYLLFTDGDCVARKDFVQTHHEYRKPGYFLSGGYFKLPLSISNKITVDTIRIQQCFDVEWLIAQGLRSSFKLQKLIARGLRQKLLNSLTPTKATWNGMNSSGYKKDIIEVNGFDQRMQYGGEDRELGERLFNNGIKAKQIRYSAVCLHLFHERGYVKSEMRLRNDKIRKETKDQKSTWTDYGLV